MPLCPQITNTPITVTQTADFTVASIVPVVAATTTQVNSAQATATTALANAAIAYNAAIASLQPSANTIVNASNQITAIAANGITVYSGASATSGARVVMNSVGLAGFDVGGSPTFSITASTGAAVFSGSITGSAITGSTLNINGNAIIDASGFLTASGATVTGTINATSGYIGSPSTGWNFSSSGYFYNSGSTTILYPSTAPGGNANTYAIYSDRGYWGSNLYSTSSAAAAIYTNGGVSATQGYFSGTAADTLRSLGGLQVASAAFAVNTSGAITATTGITASGAITTSGNISTSGSGSITAAGELNAAGHQTTGNTANGYVFTTGGRIARSTASSQRYKENIVNLRDVLELNPRKLLDFKVRAFSYKEDYLSNDDRTGVLIPGLIAEEVDAIYPLCVDYDKGEVENINDRAILINLLALVQDLYKEIDTLKGA
jgi:hypothetical protein